MKLKLMMLLFVTVISVVVAAQKNKKTNKAQGNAAVANNASKIKKAESWSLDSIKTNQAASPKKMKQGGKAIAKPVDKLGSEDDPFGKQSNNLNTGDDPFGKSPKGKYRKKTAAAQDGNIFSAADSLKTKKGKKAKADGYANQEVSYATDANATIKATAPGTELEMEKTAAEVKGVPEDNSPQSITIEAKQRGIKDHLDVLLTAAQQGVYKKVKVTLTSANSMYLGQIILYNESGTKKSSIYSNLYITESVATQTFEFEMPYRMQKLPAGGSVKVYEWVGKVWLSYAKTNMTDPNKGIFCNITLSK